MTDPNDVLTRLTALGRDLGGAYRAETIAGSAAAALMGLLSPAGVSVALETGPRGRLAVAATAGTPAPVLRSPELDRCMRTREVVRGSEPPRLLAPLIGGGTSIGVVVVDGAPGREWAPDDERALLAVAAQVTIALVNARLLALLSAGKREWEQMVDAIGAAVCIVDSRGSVHRANRTFASLTGTQVTALAGQSWQLLLPPSWWDSISRLLDDPAHAHPCELRDERRLFVASAIAIGGDAGEPRASVLILEDHTERRRLQEQLIQSEKMSAVGQLISGVAHELNNPLASILGFADFLIESGEVPAALGEPLRVVQQEAQRAAAIVKNLLTFARKQDQQRRPVAVGDVLAHTVALLRNQLIQLKVQPVIEVADGLGEVLASPNQLQQVFVNLINNAAQAIASTGRPGTVTVRARPWLDGVAIDVSDTGPGVPAEVAERIFEPFFTTKAEGEGTGLGLSICQGIVKEHGGRLSLHASGPSGATFTVELPAAPAREATHEGTQPGATPLRARVLVVDDEPHVRHYMRATLEAWGHSVATAADGEEGLRQALDGKYDVIFTDVRMPGMGGREFFESLSERAPEAAARVVFATGDTVAGDTLAFLERSCRPVLNKPFKLAELRATLSAALTSGPRSPSPP